MNLEEQIQWLKDEGIYNQWEANFVYYILNNLDALEGLDRNIIDVFSWSCAKEGTSYWNSLYTKLIKLNPQEVSPQDIFTTTSLGEKYPELLI